MGVTCCIEAVSGVPCYPVVPGTWKCLGDVLRLVWVGGPCVGGGGWFGA